jgi:hypothetical protein
MIFTVKTKKKEMITTIKHLVFITQTDSEKQTLIEIRYHKKEVQI